MAILEQIKDYATLVGVGVGAASLVFTALNSRLNARTNRARFWLDLRDRFAKHGEVHRHLRPRSGTWSAPGCGPSSADEWAQVEAYMGLFEHCEVMLSEKLIDERTFVEIYRYRLVNIVDNEVIRVEKLVKRREHWQRFLALASRMHVAVTAAQAN